MTAPRIAPLKPPYEPEVGAELSRFMPPGVPPLLLFRTLARNPRVLRKFFAGSLLDRGSLSLRERELAILRTCFRCGSEYEWGVHVQIFAGRAGLSDAEVRATCAPVPPADLFAKRDLAVLRLCDALHDHADVDDALWQEVARELAPEQIVELLVLAGFYHSVAFVTNALRIEREAGTPAFPA